MSKTPAKRGRPSAYQTAFCGQAEKLAKLGATDREVAQFLGVSEATLKTWKHTHPDFLAALKLGKEASDNRVEQTLYRRAVGYSFDSEKVFQFQGVIVRAETVEHVPPDTTAAIFWLKNRRPDLWRDVQRQEHTGANGGPIALTAIPLEALSEEQRRALATIKLPGE